MKKLLLILFLIPVITQAQTPLHFLIAKKASSAPVGPIVFVGQINAGGNVTGVTTGNLNSTGSSLIIIAISYYNGTTPNPTVSDNQSNTWTALTGQTTGGAPTTRLYYCYSPVTNATHTFSVSGADVYASINVLAFSGTSGGFDNQNGSTGGASPVSAGSITPSSDGEVVISSLATDALTTTTAITSGFTYYDQSYAGGAHYSCSIAYSIQTTATAQNCQWTWADGGNGASAIASFK